MTGNGGSNRERGMILIVVLWIVASLSLLLSATNLSVRTNNSVARAELVTAQLESLADAGIDLAVARLYARGPQRWQPDGRSYRVRIEDTVLDVRITDANALVDINKSSGKLLYSVFRTSLGSEEDATRLRDWVVANRPKAPAGGDGNSEPASGALNRTTNGSGFLSVSDLLNSRIVSSRTMDGLNDRLTVFGKSGKLNPMNTSAALLASLPGISPSEVAAIIEARSSSGGPTAFVELLSKPVRDELKQGEGPAYRIAVDVISSSFAKPVTLTATILMGTTGAAPYYILSRQPLGF